LFDTLKDKISPTNVAFDDRQESFEKDASQKIELHVVKGEKVNINMDHDF